MRRARLEFQAISLSWESLENHAECRRLIYKLRTLRHNPKNVKFRDSTDLSSATLPFCASARCASPEAFLTVAWDWDLQDLGLKTLGSGFRT